MNKTLNAVKKYKFPILFCVGIGLLFSFPLFTDGIYWGDDLFYHIGRIEGITSSWGDGQLIPRIYPYKNMGFGYASPLFYNDLFLYPIAILYKFGLPIVTSYKVLLVLLAIATACTMFYAVLKISKSMKAAYLSSLLYTFATYHALDVYARSSLGEIFALVFLPLAFALFYLIVYKHKNYWISFGITMSLLLFSHNISFVLACVVLLILTISRFKDLMKTPSTIICLGKSALFGLAISSYFIFPMLEQMMGRDLIVNHIQDIFNMNTYRQSIAQLFISSIVLASSNGSTLLGEKLSATVGPIVLFSPALFFLVKQKISDKMLYRFVRNIIVIGFILIVMTTTLINWDYLKIVQFIQFPWRLYVIITPMLSIASGILIAYFIDKIDFKIALVSLTLFSFYSFSVAINPLVISDRYLSATEKIEDIQGAKYRDPFKFGSLHNLNDVAGGEYLPYSLDMNYQTFGSCIAYSNLDCAYPDYERRGSKINLSINEEYNNVELLFPITFYKGYKLYQIDDEQNIIKEVPVYEHQYYHVVAFNIKEDKTANYYLKYEGTMIQKASFVVSLAAIICAIIVIIKRKNRGKI